MHRYYVYILSNASRILYVGVASDLPGRIYQHKQKQIPGFTARYNVTKLVYFEETNDVRAAIAREKEIKRWKRVRKVNLVGSKNPDWKDLAEEENFFLPS